MKFDWVAPAIAGVALLLTVLAQWRHRSHRAREAAAMREAIDRHQGACCERFDGLRRSHEDLETSLRNTRDTLRDGRLNRSTRAAALQLLRSGMSPDAAAAESGIAKREMRLLAKVPGLLSAN
jgi:hypothetical protein